MQYTEIARIAHDVERYYFRSLGDYTIQTWNCLKPGHKQWKMAAVRRVMDNPEDVAHTAHNSWVVDRLKEGWVQGPVEDHAKKTHPNLMLFHSLPEDARVKDRIFYAVILALVQEFC